MTEQELALKTGVEKDFGAEAKFVQSQKDTQKRGWPRSFMDSAQLEYKVDYAEW